MVCSVCAIIKNEHKYLEEWIQWNLNLGFDSIYLCEDIGSLSHEDIVAKYDNVYLMQYNSSIASYESNGGSVRQMAYFKWFIDNHKDDMDWCAFIDVDEFIHIDDGSDIHTFLEEYDDYKGIYLYWKFYGADGHIERPDGNVQDNYLKEVETTFDRGWKYKSIVHISHGGTMNSVHRVDDGVNTWKMKTKSVRTYHKAHIKHFFTKSWDDWCERFILRGDIYPGHRKLREFFKLNNDMLPLEDKLMEFYEKKAADYREQAS